VATELVARENVRLLNDLTFEAPDMPIKVRNAVVYQVPSDYGSDAETFIFQMGKSQLGSASTYRGSLPTSPLGYDPSQLVCFLRGSLGDPLVTLQHSWISRPHRLHNGVVWAYCTEKIDVKIHNYTIVGTMIVE
jgi:hypothetical protein